MSNKKPIITILSQLITHDDIKNQFISAEDEFNRENKLDTKGLEAEAIKIFDLDAELTESQIDEIFTSAVIKLTYFPESAQKKIREAILDPAIKKLDLNNCQLNATHIYLLSELLKLTSVTELLLWKNPIGDKGAYHIAKCSFIEKINVGYTKLTSKGAILLAGIPSLRWLDVSSNNIGNSGAKALADSKSLYWLNLANNVVRTQGAIALAANNHLLVLDLSTNTKIKRAGIQAFIDKNKTLIEINQACNTWDESLLTALEEMTKRNKSSLLETVIPNKLRAFQTTCMMAMLFSQAKRSAESPEDCQLGTLPDELLLQITDFILGAEDKDCQDLFLEELKHEGDITCKRENSKREPNFFKRDSVHSDKLKESVSEINNIKDNIDMVNNNSCILF